MQQRQERHAPGVRAATAPAPERERGVARGGGGGGAGCGERVGQPAGVLKRRAASLSCFRRRRALQSSKFIHRNRESESHANATSATRGHRTLQKKKKRKEKRKEKKGLFILLIAVVVLVKHLSGYRHRSQDGPKCGAGSVRGARVLLRHRRLSESEPEREHRQVCIQAGQEAALVLAGAAALQAAPELRGFRLQSAAAAAARRGAAQRARAQPGQAGQQRLRDAARARAQRRGQQEDEQGGDAALCGRVHPRPAAAARRARRRERSLPVGRPVSQRRAQLLQRHELHGRITCLLIFLRRRILRPTQSRGAGAPRFHQLVLNIRKILKIVEDCQHSLWRSRRVLREHKALRLRSRPVG